MVRDEFLERLHTALAVGSLTQTKLAERTGISRVQINQYFTGKTWPNIENSMVLAKGLGVTMSYLFDENYEREKLLSTMLVDLTILRTELLGLSSRIEDKIEKLRAFAPSDNVVIEESDRSRQQHTRKRHNGDVGPEWRNPHGD